MKWFDIWWWRYIFERPSGYARGWNSSYWLVDWYYRIRCRMANHPEGPIFYNPGGLEPDPHCRGCGDEIE